MKRFPFKFPIAVIVLLFAAIAIFATAAVLNTINAVNVFKASDGRTTYAIIHAVIAVLSLSLTVISAAVLFFSRYEIKNGALISRFGFFRAKTEVKDIFQITEFKAQKKLAIYIVPERYAVIVIKEKYYEKFLSALKENNPYLLYTIKGGEENE